MITIMSESASLPMDSLDSTLVTAVSAYWQLRFWQTVKLPSSWPIAIVQNQNRNFAIPGKSLT